MTNYDLKSISHFFRLKIIRFPSEKIKNFKYTPNFFESVRLLFPPMQIVLGKSIKFHCVKRHLDLSNGSHCSRKGTCRHIRASSNWKVHCQSESESVALRYGAIGLRSFRFESSIPTARLQTRTVALKAIT